MLKRLIYPLRKAVGAFALTPEWRNPPWMVPLSLIEKAAWFVASEKIKGDYIEFGVYQGASLIAAYQAFERIFRQRISEQHNQSAEDAAERQAIWNRMRFFAFDSFQGLPEPEEVDREGMPFGKGQYAAGLREFVANLSANHVLRERVIEVPGWFDDTCTEATRTRHKMRKAAVIWIDGDLYASAKTCLSFVTPLIQDGTVLIFDDWYNFKGNPRRGEQLAFAEWSRTMTGLTFHEYQKEGPWRIAFIASEIR